MSARTLSAEEQNFFDMTPVLPSINEIEKHVSSFKIHNQVEKQQSFLHSITSNNDDLVLQDSSITRTNRNDTEDFEFNLPRRSASTIRSKSVPLRTRTEWKPRNSPPIPRARSEVTFHDAPGQVLAVRGTLYSPLDGEVDWKGRLRTESARRRIRRIQWVNKHDEELKRRETSRRKFKAAALTVMMAQRRVLSAAESNTSTTTTIRTLRHRISNHTAWKMKRAVTLFQWAVGVVRIACRVMQFMKTHSAKLEPWTAAQESWYALRHTKEAKEIIFSKEAYSRGKNSFAYVPGWARDIMNKHPEERSDAEIRQLCNMCRGLKAFDKFTHSIQLAMCRAFTYMKVDYPRQVLRKGHLGLSFYFVFSGSLFVNIEELDQKTNQMRTRTHVTLTRGDSFGELALLRQIRRTASVATQQDTELLVVDKHNFVEICPRLFDRELEEKVAFCRELPLFDKWPEELIKDIGVEAQILRYKANQVIVEDSKTEVDWIYACMEGKCSILRILDEEMFRHHPAARFSSVHSLGVVSVRGELSHSEPRHAPRVRMRKRGAPKSHGLLKELEKNLRSDKYFNLQLQPNAKDSETSEDISDDELSDDQTEEEKDQSRRRDEKAKANKETVSLAVYLRRKKEEGLEFLEIASIGPGQIFDLVGLVNHGRRLVLVSHGCKMIKIKKKLFMRISTKFSLERLRQIAPRYDYPSDRVLHQSYAEKFGWQQFKDNVVESVLTQLRGKCVRHQLKPEDKTSPTAVKFVK